MEAKPTYHLPPNYSIPTPAQGGPLRLGTVLARFEEREQMRPLNQGDDDRFIAIPKIHLDHKGGFVATRKKLKSGEMGVWAKFMGLEGIRGETSVAAERSSADTYTCESVETEFFYPNDKYISDCLNLGDVYDFLDGSRYKKPVYLVTGLKIGKGVHVRMEKKTNVSGKLESGVANAQVGTKVEGKMETEPVYAFTESSDILVGIQCLKIYHERSGWVPKRLGTGKKEVRSEYVTSGAVFYSCSDEATPESKLAPFFVVDPKDHDEPGMVGCKDGEEFWMIPRVVPFTSGVDQETPLDIKLN